MAARLQSSFDEVLASASLLVEAASSAPRGDTHQGTHATLTHTPRLSSPHLSPTYLGLALSSLVPSLIPSLFPSLVPSLVPSLFPSLVPSLVPSLFVSLFPSLVPSLFLSLFPSLFIGSSLSRTDAARHRLLSESLVDEARGAAIDTPAVGAAGGEGEAQMVLGATRLEQISKAVRAMVQDLQHGHTDKH
ncbi:unnamed protein product [Closterium sp. NIES-64]|nr:unnamed protein product [Closterium sp. NIES-64]